MIRNSPYDHPEGPLVSLVATPIGNIKDITLRALDAFKEADVIACEDTRNTGLLLSRLGIKPKKLVSLYAQTEAKNAKLLVEEAKKKNWKVCYCSDAGMPGISDPGALLSPGLPGTGRTLYHPSRTKRIPFRFGFKRNRQCRLLLLRFPSDQGRTGEDDAK
jgi:hypothetical protein